LNSDSFPVLHGLPGFRDCTGLVGTSPSSVNLFIVLEIVRAVQWAKTHWPGARKLLDWGFETEFRERPPECAAEALLRESILDPARSESAKILLSEAGRIINAFDAANAINEIPLREIAETLPELGARYIRAFAFLPDFLFPTELSAPPSDSLVADLRNAAEKRRRKNDPSETDPEKIANTDESGKAEPEETNSESALPARFWYPEWNQTEAVYQENWCGVGEIHPKETRENTIPDNLREQAKRVQRIFERLRPEITRTERRLEDGDSITFERLVQYRVNRRLEPEPKVDFYEKPMILRRDLAVLILLDVSGSTADTAGSGKVIELEKNAAVILGEGLHALGDRFAVCGFSSNGRENCEFHRYKNFPDPWNPTSIGRILAAFPSNSTRMGAALRHAGEILFKIEAKQRLILLVTDGKPMDSGYDPHTRYAQHDVRMACEENLRKSIATFAISTEENSLADMEIMFPQRRFAILPDIRRLPDVLPRLYVRITVS
jgi:nitric oxide reductase activation protein